MNPKSLPSRLFHRNPGSTSGESLGPASAHKYQRHVDCVEGSDLDSSSKEDEERHREKIHFTFVPETYEPLMDEARAAAQEEKKKRKKAKYKKVKKNVGKALRASWKCLMLGFYNFALGYSTPITVAATFVPDFHRGRNWPNC